MSVVGIDLGTTNSCVSILSSRGTLDILMNDVGRKTTPSIVSFKENGDILVGQDAKNHMVMNPSNTIFGIKRLIGYKYVDKQIDTEKETYSYSIVPGKDGMAAAEVTYRGEKRIYSPEEISGYILTKLKNSAAQHLTAPVEKAVITVPAYFSSSQRKSTKVAGKIAGIDVIGIISEPTAAAIAYCYKTIDTSSERVIFVFDFGGGTLDCTLMKAKDNKFDVITTSGNTHLGGEDIDMALLKYAADQFKKETGINVFDSKYKRELVRLKLECESVKCKLSNKQVKVQEINIPNFINGKDLKTTITTSKFNYICTEVLESLEEPLSQVFDDASEKLGEEIDPSEFVDDIIMVGGSSHIPRVAEVLKDFFDKDPIYGIDPDTAVAQGAALYAASLADVSRGFNVIEDVSRAERPTDNDGRIALITDEEIALLHKNCVRDVIPLSLGVENNDGSFSVILKNNTPVPAEETQVRITVCDYQTRMKFDIYEGQRTVAKDNRLLGSFTITDITPRLRGETKANITFKITKENILEIYAKEIGGTAEGGLNIDYNFGDIKEEDVAEMMKRAEEFRKSDEEIIKTNKANNDLDDLISKARRSSNSKVNAIADSMERWKSYNSNAHSREIYDKIEEFKSQLRPYISV